MKNKGKEGEGKMWEERQKKKERRKELNHIE